MGLCFGIQILGLNPDFDINYSTVMWDENAGPVEVFYQNFTVYSSGGRVMEVAANMGRATRIVSFSTNVNPPSNPDSTNGRTSEIGFQLRVSGTGGEFGQFYNFTNSTTESLAFSQSKGSSATSYTRSLASEVRAVNIVPGTRYDFFQQTWTNR
jgi:hypothetical protein